MSPAVTSDVAESQWETRQLSNEVGGRGTTEDKASTQFDVLRARAIAMQNESSSAWGVYHSPRCDYGSRHQSPNVDDDSETKVEGTIGFQKLGRDGKI